jgi:hypothetical protein
MICVRPARYGQPMHNGLLLALAPALVGFPLIEIWRRRAVRRWRNDRWAERRSRELRDAMQGEYQPELAVLERDAA